MERQLSFDLLTETRFEESASKDSVGQRSSIVCLVIHLTKKARARMTEIEERIANTARAINRQIDTLARAKSRQTKNVWIDEDGKIVEIENHMELQNRVDDAKRILNDMLRNLDQLLKERDGV